MRFRIKNKDTEAALRGYLFFDVNGRRYWSYYVANEATNLITGNVRMRGLHILKGWRGLYMRIEASFNFEEAEYIDWTPEMLEERRRQLSYERELQQARRYYRKDVP